MINNFVKVWECPENAEKKAPIACYKCSIVRIVQYGETDFRPDINHIMTIGNSPKSFSSLEDAINYINSEEWE